MKERENIGKLAKQIWSFAVCLIFFFCISSFCSQYRFSEQNKISIVSISSGSDEERMPELEREKTEAIRKNLKIERKKRSVVEKEKGILKVLQSLEIELGKKERQLAQHKLQLAYWNEQIGKSQKRLDQMKEELEKYKILAGNRIRAMYKLSYNKTLFNPLKFLAPANDLSELLSRYKYINSISKADREILINLQSKMSHVQMTENEIKDRIQSIEKAKKEIEHKKINILFNKRRREKLLEKYRTDKETYDRTIVELESAVAKFRKLLGEVEEERMERNELENLNKISEKLIGRLPLPTQGKIISNASTSENGITIRAKKGSEIRSVAKGIVARVENSIVGYGKTILIDHGNEYISVYAHASEILVKEGQMVKKRQIIAKVGETGSLTGSILYFELWHGVKRLDTKKWMKKK